MLLNFNHLSENRFATTQLEFRKHIQLLLSTKKDLENVFRRIRQVKFLNSCTLENCLDFLLNGHYKDLINLVKYFNSLKLFYTAKSVSFTSVFNIHHQLVINSYLKGIVLSLLEWICWNLHIVKVSAPVSSSPLIHVTSFLRHCRLTVRKPFAEPRS